MKTISFNTGREYSKNGQRIAAGQLDCGRVLFVDIDRGLEYVTAAPCDLNQRDVMRFYDYNSTISSFGVIPDYAIREKMIGELKALAAKQ